jgi:hypothetical protein
MEFTSTEKLHADIFNGGKIHCEFSVLNPYCEIIDDMLFIISLDDRKQFISIYMRDIVSLEITTKICCISFDGGMVTFYNDY